MTLHRLSRDVAIDEQPAGFSYETVSSYAINYFVFVSCVYSLSIFCLCCFPGLLVLVKNWYGARCQWLTPVILATQEAEIRRIAVQSQPRQIVHETLS
jgi:hypothetical protein